MIPDVTMGVETAGLATLLAAAFGGGLLLSATPCVYPMIPVTVAAFAGRQASRGRAVSLALLYVAGIAIMYAALGVWAAATGRLFGALLADPRVTGGFAALFLLLGAIALGWLPRVESWLGRTPGWITAVGSASPVGALAMGLVAGVVFAPCVGPFVVGVLAHVASTGDLFLGGVLLATVGLGMGTPFVVLAVAAGELSRWPRAGGLPRLARFILGGALLVTGLYYASLSVSDLVLRALATGTFVVVGLDRLAAARREGARPAGLAWGGVALACLGLAATVGLREGPLPGTKDEVLLSWRSDADAALADARASGRHAVLDFTADWCLACHELDRRTLSHPDVARLLAGAERIRVDATRMTAEVEALFSRFRIFGLPAVLVVDPRGEIVEAARITSFVPPEEASRLFRLAGLEPVRDEPEFR